MRKRRILGSLVFLVSLSAFSASGSAAAPGKTPLPKSEADTIEQDLDEDDHSFDGLDAEKIRSTENPDHDADSILSAPASPSPTAPQVEEPKEYSSPLVGEPSHEELSPEDKPEKIFDWSKHQGETEVKHPFAEKGLQRITKDRTYFYKVEESDQKSAVSVHAGMFDPINLVNPDAEDSTYASFESNYDQSSNPAIMFEYEWQLWRTPVGKFGLRIGSGIFVAQGHGHFVHNYNPDVAVEPRETFTFMMFPNTLGAVYRFHMAHKQLFIPYIEGGGVAFAFTELRDDDKGPKFGGALGAYGAGGVGINLTYFDYMTRTQLDREYGINACYLTVEYRRFQAITTRYDFSSDYLNGGFLMEY